MTATSDIDDIEAIKALIQAFFDRINDSDPEGLQKLFVPNAHLAIIRQNPDRAPPDSSAWSSLPQTPIKDTSSPLDEEYLTNVYQSSIESFIKLVVADPGNDPSPKVHEVPDLDATDVKIDSLFATAWSPFCVTFDGVLHHYGTFVFTFGKDERSSGDQYTEKKFKFETVVQNYRRTPGWSQGHVKTLSMVQLHGCDA